MLVDVGADDELAALGRLPVPEAAAGAPMRRA